jgi:hypothetical protein
VSLKRWSLWNHLRYKDVLSQGGDGCFGPFGESKFIETKWAKLSTFCFSCQVGDRVCVRRSVAEPRYAWGGETHHSVGKISEVSSDGLLMIDITGRPILWQADPADMEKVEEFKVCSCT